MKVIATFRWKLQVIQNEDSTHGRNMPPKGGMMMESTKRNKRLCFRRMHIHKSRTENYTARLFNCLICWVRVRVIVSVRVTISVMIMVRVGVSVRVVT